MKLVRESISSFERGKDPKDALGLGTRAQIKQWFDNLGIDELKYEIKDDLSIVVKGSLNLINTHLTEIPTNNLTVIDWLDLRNTSITKLPDNLSVGGSLLLINAKITKLPDNLSVGGSLDLENVHISQLPDNLIVGGYLNLKGTQITELPDNLTVGGSTYRK